MKTKVWLVIWGLKDGGAEALTREYARLVDPETFEPTIITMYPFPEMANYQRAMEAGIKVQSVFNSRTVFTRAVRILFGRWYVPYILKKMIDREQPKAIHFNSPMGYCFAPLKKHLSGINLLYTCHSEVDKHFFPKEEAAVRQMINSHGLRLIGLHDDMKHELDQRFSTKNAVVIRNGIDLRRFTEQKADRDAVRQSIGIDKDAYVVGHVGRFSAPKNHGFLLQVFQKVRELQPKAHLLLVGNGELKEQITQQITQMHLEQQVTVLSHRTDIPELLQAMDVMIFPSLYEGLSVTLVEAQATGLRCVISDSINTANLLAPTTIPVSLEVSVEEWAQTVLNKDLTIEDCGNIEDYDMNREIRRLERLYLGELEV